jgi:beta-aspartyl-peptidase (threonine type)
MKSSEFSVIIHGGAGGFVDDADSRLKEPFLKAALDAGWNALLAGEGGERAMIRAMMVLEGCEYFDAGYGSYPNEHGKVFMDVALMRGSGDFISLVNVRKVKYPSALALDMLRPGRSLMRVWTDRMHAGLEDSADEFKERYGYVRTEEEMIAPYALESGQRARSAASQNKGSGTIGCVIRDGEGRIFAGTSTGGIPNKPDGRVGDTPIIGSGCFADDQIGGLSATGHGEVIMKSLLSGYVIAEMRGRLASDANSFTSDGKALKNILDRELGAMRAKYPGGEAGLIVIPKIGMPAFSFNSEAMNVGMRVGSAQGISHEEWKVARAGR